MLSRGYGRYPLCLCHCTGKEGPCSIICVNCLVYHQCSLLLFANVTYQIPPQTLHMVAVFTLSLYAIVLFSFKFLFISFSTKSELLFSSLFLPFPRPPLSLLPPSLFTLKFGMLLQKKNTFYPPLFTDVFFLNCQIDHLNFSFIWEL